MLGGLSLILKVLSNDTKVTDTHGNVFMNTGYREVIIVHMPTVWSQGPVQAACPGPRLLALM